MNGATLIGILLLGAIVSVESLKCLSCSHTPATPDDACLNGKTNSSQVTSDPVCFTFVLYDSNKRISQMVRKSYSSANLPNANSDCSQATDAQGKIIYAIACTCNSSDNCNNVIINNCKCEKAPNATNTTSTTNTTVASPTTLTTKPTNTTTPTTTSGKGLSCLTCSHTPGALTDEACLSGKTISSSPSSDPICVVFGYFDSNKRVLQVARSSYPTANIPLANSDCLQTTDLQGNTVFSIMCTCNSSNCNSYNVSNCKCDKASLGGGSNVTTVAPPTSTPAPPNACTTRTMTDPNTFATTTTGTTVNTTSTDTTITITVTTTITVVTTIPKPKNGTLITSP